MRVPSKIGLDLDNTLIDYSQAFVALAVELDLIAPSAGALSKVEVKEMVLAQHGEEGWMRLQGQVYGAGIGRASLYDGVLGFLARCRDLGVEVRIASHKTRYGHFDPERVDLHRAATGFLVDRGVLGEGAPLDMGAISYHETLEEKISAIAAFSPQWFVDDLEKVFNNADFPHDITKVLFSPENISGPWHTCASWAEITKYILCDKI